jgi:brefeldin A-resistance guanine nucleotide exchange factor 1
MRSVGLSILSLALEISGSQIDLLPSLRGLIADQGCKFLFQLARSENISILQMGLRIITTLFGTMPAHLKLQQELFLTFTIDKLTPPPLPLVPKLQNSLNTPSISEKSRVSSSSRPTTPLPGYSSPSLNGTEKQSFDLSIETPPPTPRPGVLPARGEVKELMLETLGHLSRHPSFMVDLWVNYDCDVDCEDVFERLVGFLTKVNSFVALLTMSLGTD